MALANVAVELAKRGRRVLMVDFDLEAPGLDTFRVPLSTSSTLGIVDYVQSYLETGTPPRLDEYFYKLPIEVNSSGEIWVMPAGKQDKKYDSKYKAIDWQELYAKRNGFLFFENLKAEWERFLNPDYVLIDSRTGHTDVGGICTRQLPHAVLVFFFPNEQNRRGLESIVRQIREEENGPLEKVITLHFVMANVPDLDDEEEILSANLQKIKATLNFNEPSAVIHHYNSLALLNQVIFSLERPKSRLAQEYRYLTSTIVRNNLEDEEGAIEFLDEAIKNVRNRLFADTSGIESELELIRGKFTNNVEVLRRLARLRQRQAKTQDALSFLNSAVKLGLHEPDVLLARAELNLSFGNIETAQSDLIEILGSKDLSSFDLTVAIRLLRKTSPAELPRLLLTAPALETVKFNTELARELEGSIETLAMCETLLRRWRTELSGVSDLDTLRQDLVLCLIGQGQFEQAKNECASGKLFPLPDELKIQEAYNYAMAEWGLTGNIEKKFFERVMTLHAKRPPSHDPNYWQCITVSAWAVGSMLDAKIYLHRTLAMLLTGSVFSTWSYLNVSSEKFMEELLEMSELLDTENFVPQFIRRARAIH